MENIDEEILTQALQGHMQAFETIYKATVGFVYGTALRITNSHPDAQEVTQDVYLKIHRHLGKFKAGTSLKAWIYRITVNNSINTYNKNSREHSKREKFGAIALKADNTQAQADEGILQREDADQLAQVLEGLTPNQRACILLREIEGLDYKEIAEVLKININTVRSRLKRARATLFTYGKGVQKNEM